MLSELNFDNLEVIDAVKNISTQDDIKAIICTITLVQKEFSINHLTGLEYEFAKLKLEEDDKLIKLCSSYMFNTCVLTNYPIKVVFNQVNNKYRNVSRNENDDTSTVIDDVNFIDMIFQRTENNKVYL